jgi:hypothetical protein
MEKKFTFLSDAFNDVFNFFIFDPGFPWGVILLFIISIIITDIGEFYFGNTYETFLWELKSFFKFPYTKEKGFRKRWNLITNDFISSKDFLNYLPYYFFSFIMQGIYSSLIVMVPIAIFSIVIEFIINFVLRFI